MIQVGGGKPSGPVSAIRQSLEKIALRATELGRESTAVAAVNALQQIAGVEVKNVTIANSTFDARTYGAEANR